MQRTYAPRTHVPSVRTEPERPTNNPYVSIPAGRYALMNVREDRWYFFKVDNPTDGKWAGWTFLKQINGGNEDTVRGEKREMILRHIMENPLGAAADYGKETAHCGMCNTQLTDPDSIARGIGPVCAKKF